MNIKRQAYLTACHKRLSDKCNFARPKSLLPIHCIHRNSGGNHCSVTVGETRYERRFLDIATDHKMQIQRATNSPLIFQAQDVIRTYHLTIILFSARSSHRIPSSDGAPPFPCDLSGLPITVAQRTTIWHINKIGTTRARTSRGPYQYMVTTYSYASTNMVVLVLRWSRDVKIARSNFLQETASVYVETCPGHPSFGWVRPILDSHRWFHGKNEFLKNCTVNCFENGCTFIVVSGHNTTYN